MVTTSTSAPLRTQHERRQRQLRTDTHANTRMRLGNTQMCAPLRASVFGGTRRLTKKREKRMRSTTRERGFQRKKEDTHTHTLKQKGEGGAEVMLGPRVAAVVGVDALAVFVEGEGGNTTGRSRRSQEEGHGRKASHMRSHQDKGNMEKGGGGEGTTSTTKPRNA